MPDRSDTDDASSAVHNLLPRPRWLRCFAMHITEVAPSAALQLTWLADADFRMQVLTFACCHGPWAWIRPLWSVLICRNL